MSDNIWNSLSVSAEHRKERERERKSFLERKEKKKGIIFIGMRSLAQIIINDRCCWSRFEISSDLFRQNRNRIFFPLFFLHITMNNRIRDTRYFFFFIYLLFYTRPLIVTKLRENEFTNSIPGNTNESSVSKRKISRVDKHRVYKVSRKDDGPTNHRNRNNSRERPRRFRGGSRRSFLSLSSRPRFGDPPPPPRFIIRRYTERSLVQV